MRYVVECKGLYAGYEGNIVLRDLSVSYECCKVHCIVGPNASGKTTFLRVIATVLMPIRGYIRILGLDPYTHTNEIRKMIGTLLEQETMINLRLTVEEFLRYFSYLHGISGGKFNDTVDEILARLGLQKYLHTPIYKLSRGLRRKVLIAKALVNNPKLVLLDEPLIGLDVSAVNDVIRLLKDLKDRGKTIIVTLHYLDLIDELCDTVTVIMGGKVMFKTEVKDLLRNSPWDYKLTIAHQGLTDINKILTEIGVKDTNEVLISPRRDEVSLLVRMNDIVEMLPKLLTLAKSLNIKIEVSRLKAADIVARYILERGASWS